MMSVVTNHLWQSTVFAIVAGLLSLAFRKNRAHVRYWLWFSASLKFLIPFSLLLTLGAYLGRSRAAGSGAVPGDHLHRHTSGRAVSPKPSASGADEKPRRLDPHRGRWLLGVRIRGHGADAA